MPSACLWLPVIFQVVSAGFVLVVEGGLTLALMPGLAGWSPGRERKAGKAAQALAFLGACAGSFLRQAAHHLKASEGIYNKTWKPTAESTIHIGC